MFLCSFQAQESCLVTFDLTWNLTHPMTMVWFSYASKSILTFFLYGLFLSVVQSVYLLNVFCLVCNMKRVQLLHCCLLSSQVNIMITTSKINGSSTCRDTCNSLDTIHSRFSTQFLFLGENR